LPSVRREVREEGVVVRTYKQAERERKYRWWQEKRQRDMERVASRPLHEIHPGMLAVLDAVQRQRPSYAAWLHSFFYREGPR